MSAQVIQTINYPEAFENPRFSFLAKPPPQKRRRAPMPCPPPPGSPPPVPVASTALPGSPNALHKARSILSWATHVQPGSPAPRSPHQRRLSNASTASRRSSLLQRRPSVSGVTHTRAAEGGQIAGLVDFTAAMPSGFTPIRTPSTGKFDLTTLGYASVFVQFPKTPTTPSPYLREYRIKRGEQPDTPVSAGPKSVKAALASIPLSAGVLGRIPVPAIPVEADTPKQKTVKRFRSLTILRPAKAKPSKEMTKKQMYPALKQKKHAPPPLANELALMQFADGGRLEDHAQRMMEAQARAAAGHAAGNAPGVGVGTVHRDATGGMWWDADEEMEYAPLIDGETSPNGTWEVFTTLSPSADTNANPPVSANSRAERSSVSTAASSLAPGRLVQLPELTHAGDAAAFSNVDRALAAPMRTSKPSVLAVPTRAKRASPHLTAGFLVDGVTFVPVPPSPGSLSKTRMGNGGGVVKKARRRPAPLKLANSAHAVRCSRRSPRAPVAAPVCALPPAPAPELPLPNHETSTSSRRMFLEDSFIPEPMCVDPSPPQSILIGVGSVSDLYEPQGAQKKRRAGGVRALFGLRRAD